MVNFSKEPVTNKCRARYVRVSGSAIALLLALNQIVLALNRQLRLRKKTYNCVRPHQSLATSPHWNLSPDGNTTSEEQGITHLPDEYKSSTRHRNCPRIKSLSWKTQRSLGIPFNDREVEPV